MNSSLATQEQQSVPIGTPCIAAASTRFSHDDAVAGNSFCTLFCQHFLGRRGQLITCDIANSILHK